MDDEVRIRAKQPVHTSVSLSAVAGRPAVVVRLQPPGDALPFRELDGDLLTEAATLAREQEVPLVWYLSSRGADIESGPDALASWGRAARALVACSGVVPTVCCVTGVAVAGPALLLGLVDVVIMVDQAYAYVSGPRMVQQFTGVPVDNMALGGARLHARTSGVAALIAHDAGHAGELVEEVLGFLPDNSGDLPPDQPTADPADRLLPDIHTVIPDTATGSYDVRDIVTELVDDAHFLELRSAWATNMVTGLASIGGYGVGIVANQPEALAGTLDIAASQKGARFVSMCDAYNLPLVTLVDTPGFYPGKDLEWRGMIRHGAQLAFAFARATVPRINLTLRKSYGGAYIVMDSKHMGNDLALAWPSAEIAVMGAKGAVEILHRRADAATRAAAEADYEQRLLNPYRAAERGSVDRVIEPAESRREVAAALEVLVTKQERTTTRRHDNTPL